MIWPNTAARVKKNVEIGRHFAGEEEIRQYRNFVSWQGAANICTTISIGLCGKRLAFEWSASHKSQLHLSAVSPLRRNFVRNLMSFSGDKNGVG